MKHSPEHASNIYDQLKVLDPEFPIVAKILFECFSQSGRAMLKDIRDRTLLPRLVREKLESEHLNKEEFFEIVKRMLENDTAVEYIVHFVNYLHATHNVRDLVTDELLETSPDRLRETVANNTRLSVFRRLVYDLEKYVLGN